MIVKLVLQQLGPRMPFEASLWDFSSKVDLSSMPNLLRAKYVLLLAVVNITVDSSVISQ